MEDNNETWSNVEANTLSEQQMDKEFHCGYGSPEGEPFTIWTKNRIYFPIQYDGLEWVSSVARHPDGKPTEHKGC